ncbi:glycosyltransferase [Ideonella paludis]
MHARPGLKGVDHRTYAVQRRPVAGQHALLRESEAKVLRGEACAVAMLALAREGFVPDLVVCNPAWGEALYVKDVFPAARLVCLMEFFYGTPDADVGFDPEFPVGGVESRLRQRMKNMALTEALLTMDQGVAPTAWQASRLPNPFQPKVEVVFDGIDTQALRPDPQARFELPALGLAFAAGAPLITFVNRNLEPYRGYHRFLRALPTVLKQVPDAQVVLVGGDGVSYGAPAPQGQTWKQIYWGEVAAQLDASRVHFVGQLPYADYQKLLQVSAAHVYLTYPFVLSWSCLEAMSLGCHVIGSRTAPVQEYIEDGINGHLVDFFDTEALAEAMIRALAQRGQDAALRQAARQTAVSRCDLRTVCLPQWRSVLSRTMGSPV